MKYMAQGNYFEISPDAQPFLHYWSLSVEEQFYLVFPITVFLIFRYARNHIVPILSIVGALSFVANVWLTSINSVWAFYLLPTRAWQLIAGCLIAVLPFAGAPERLAPRWLSIAGLFLVLSSYMFIEEGPWFPGWVASLPVIGAAAIILPSGGGVVKAWLSSSVMVGIGKVSYSLYLWHWPVSP